MANNTPTINFLKNVFTLFYANHKFLNGFDFGGSEWNLDTTKDTQFPYMYVETGASRWPISYDSQSFLTEEQTFKIYCIDRISKGDPNYIEVLSDCKYTLETYISEINQHQYLRDLGIILTDEVRFDPLYEFSKDNCNGWVAEFTLRYPMRFNPCNNPYIPIAGYTYSLNNYTSEVRLVGSVGATGPTGPAGTSGTSGMMGTSGTSGTSGAVGATGAGGAQGYYGVFYSSVTQTNPTASTANIMKVNQTVENNGVVVLNQKSFQSTYGGTYNIQFSAQFEHTQNSTATYDIWFMKGSPSSLPSQISFSNTRNTIYKNPGQPGYQVPAWNFVVTLQPLEYIEIWWSSSDTGVQMTALGGQSGPSRPAIPSLIVTMTQVMYMQASTSGTSGTGTHGTSGTSGAQGPAGPLAYCQSLRFENNSPNGPYTIYYTDCSGNGQSWVLYDYEAIDLCIFSTDGYSISGDGADYIDVFDLGICNGTSGTDGAAGNNGSSGTSGVNGTSGTSGVSGAAGATGTSGTSGTRGTSGISGTAGTSGVAGAAGATGTSGTSGTRGTSGINGTAGTSGTTPPGFSSGTSGTRGTSGTSGPAGANGANGTSGTSGSGGGSTLVAYPNTCFVHPDGNDTTGQIGRFDKPFATIAGAFYGTSGLNNDPAGMTAGVTNGVIEVWPATVGAENANWNNLTVPSRFYDYNETQSLIIISNFKLHLKPGVHIKWNAPDQTSGITSGAYFKIYGDLDSTKMIRVEVTSEDQTNSIEQVWNTEAFYNHENYLLQSNYYTNITFENLTLFSQPISWVNTPDTKGQASMNIGINGNLMLDRVIFRTDNEPYITGEFDQGWWLSNIYCDDYGTLFIKDSFLFCMNFNNQKGNVYNTNMEWNANITFYNSDRHSNRCILLRSEFTTLFNQGNIGISNNNAIHCICAQTGTIFFVITDCQFNAETNPGSIYQYGGGDGCCIYNDYGDLQVTLLSRNLQNYNNTTGIYYENVGVRTITEMTGGGVSDNLFTYFPIINSQKIITT